MARTVGPLPRLRGTLVYQSCIGYCPGLVFGSIGATRCGPENRAVLRMTFNILPLILPLPSFFFQMSPVGEIIQQK
jgi:hypothetical protein